MKTKSTTVSRKIPSFFNSNCRCNLILEWLVKVNFSILKFTDFLSRHHRIKPYIPDPHIYRWWALCLWVLVFRRFTSLALPIVTTRNLIARLSHWYSEYTLGSKASSRDISRWGESISSYVHWWAPYTMRWSRLELSWIHQGRVKRWRVKAVVAMVVKTAIKIEIVACSVNFFMVNSQVDAQFD